MSTKKKTIGDTDFIEITPEKPSKVRTTAPEKAPIIGQQELSKLLQLPVEQVIPVADYKGSYEVRLPEGCDEEGQWKAAREFDRIADCLITSKTDHGMRMEGRIRFSVARIELR